MTTQKTIAKDHPVATDLGKNFAGGLATSAGMLAGSYLFGVIRGRIEARKVLKDATSETDTEE